MSLRFDAISNLVAPEIHVNGKAEKSSKVTGVFGSSVFTLKTAREFLSDEAFKSLQASIKNKNNVTNSA
jgi:glutamine synthetase